MAADRPTEALIARLAADARPVRRLWSPGARFILWLAVAALVLGAATLALGLRADLADKLRAVAFELELLLLGLASVCGAALALRAAIPGSEPASGPVAGAFAVVLLALGAAFAAEPSMDFGLARSAAMGWPCAVKTVAIALLPWLVLMTCVHRGATLVPALAGLLAGAATLFLAALAVRVTCPLDERWHLLGFHFAPVVAGGALSVALGAVWLARWRRRR